jgi:hypothetical protein
MTPTAQWLLVLLFSVLVVAQSAIAIQQYNEKTPTTEANYIFSIIVISTAVIATLASLVKLGKEARSGGLRRMYGNLRSDASGLSQLSL